MVYNDIVVDNVDGSCSELGTTSNCKFVRVTVYRKIMLNPW